MKDLQNYTLKMHLFITDGDLKECIRPRCRWVNNIKMDLREIEWDGTDWIDLAQGRDKWRALVNAVVKFRGSS
jgi:hypothetical protein